jgi:hypothetical protein
MILPGWRACMLREVSKGPETGGGEREACGADKGEARHANRNARRRSGRSPPVVLRRGTRPHQVSIGAVGASTDGGVARAVPVARPSRPWHELDQSRGGAAAGSNARAVPVARPPQPSQQQDLSRGGGDSAGIGSARHGLSRCGLILWCVLRSWWLRPPCLTSRSCEVKRFKGARNAAKRVGRAS